jgi:hypothetical protein
MTAIGAAGTVTCTPDAWATATNDITRSTGKVLIGGMPNTVLATVGVRNNVAGQAAVLGENTVIPTTKGMLGVQTTANYEGTTLPQGEEIGVFGMSTGGSTADNSGVFGYSNGEGTVGQHIAGNRGALGTATAGVIGTSGSNTGRLGTTNAGVETNTLRIGPIDFNPLLRGQVAGTTLTGESVAGVTVANPSPGQYTFTCASCWGSSPTILVTAYQAGQLSLDSCQYSSSASTITVNCLNTNVGTGTTVASNTNFSILVLGN